MLIVVSPPAEPPLSPRAAKDILRELDFLGLVNGECLATAAKDGDRPATGVKDSGCPATTAEDDDCPAAAAEDIGCPATARLHIPVFRIFFFRQKNCSCQDS